MKALCYLFFGLIFISCSSTRITESWRNPEYPNYQPKKIVLFGITKNLTARKIYEEKLKKVFLDRGIEAAESYDVLQPNFTNYKQTEKNIEKEVDSLAKKGFDAILISTVLGIDEKSTFDLDLLNYSPYPNHLNRYYYVNQEVYFNNRVYENYKVYHIEISLFNLVEGNEKSLVWVASYDIVDPQKINATIKDCVTAIIASMEEEGFIPLKN